MQSVANQYAIMIQSAMQISIRWPWKRSLLEESSGAMQSECNQYRISVQDSQSVCNQYEISVYSACALSMCTQHALSMCTQPAISMQSACGQRAVSVQYARNQTRSAFYQHARLRLRGERAATLLTCRPRRKSRCEISRPNLMRGWRGWR